MTPALPGRSRTRAVLATVAAIAMAVLGAVAGADRAAAAPGDILVSTDGISYVQADQAEPFAGVGVLVPGDSVQRSMWIRNNTTIDAYLRLSVTELTVPLTSYPDALSLTTTVDSSSRYDLFSGLTVCSALVRSVAIPAGGVVRVDFTIALDPSLPGVVAQDETAVLGVGIQMRDRIAGPYPGADGCVTEPADGAGSGAGGSSGKLPFTGADVVPLLMVGLSSLLGGIVALLVLMVRRRRRGREGES